MTTGVESVSDASTHVDTESDPTLSSFDVNIDSDYPTSSAFSWYVLIYLAQMPN